MEKTLRQTANQIRFFAKEIAELTPENDDDLEQVSDPELIIRSTLRYHLLEVLDELQTALVTARRIKRR